jgi:hypothetical protein
MDTVKQIEYYVGRGINTINEVGLYQLGINEQLPPNTEYINPELRHIITFWNIQDKPQPIYDQIKDLTDPQAERKLKIQQDIETLTAWFNNKDNVPLGVQVALKEAKNEVAKLMLSDNYTEALEVIQTYPLPEYLETGRQSLITELNSLM